MQQHNSENKKGAIALGYNQSKDSAPKVLAKGIGKLAGKIIEIANENNVTVKEDEFLYRALEKTEVGEEIPEKLYRLIAELLAFIYKTESKLQRRIL